MVGCHAGNNPVRYVGSSGHCCKSGDVYESGSKTKQIIKNRYPNEPQTVKRFNYVIENGKIHIASGTDVQVAGTLKINSQGYVRSIS